MHAAYTARPATSEERAAVAPRPTRSSAPSAGEDPDYSIYPDWTKANEESRTLFRELKTLVDQFGTVRTDVATSVISLKCVTAAGQRAPVFAWVYVTVQSGLRVLIYEKHVRDIPLEGGFTRPSDGGKYRTIFIREREDLRRAESLLHAAYAARRPSSEKRAPVAPREPRSCSRSDLNQESNSVPHRDTRGRMSSMTAIVRLRRLLRSFCSIWKSP